MSRKSRSNDERVVRVHLVHGAMRISWTPEGEWSIEWPEGSGVGDQGSAFDEGPHGLGIGARVSAAADIVSVYALNLPTEVVEEAASVLLSEIPGGDDPIIEVVQ